MHYYVLLTLICGAKDYTVFCQINLVALKFHLKLLLIQSQPLFINDMSPIFDFQ